MAIMVVSMVPLVVSMVPIRCSPMVVIWAIEALNLRVVAEVVVITNLVHDLIKFSPLLVLAFLFLMKVILIPILKGILLAPSLLHLLNFPLASMGGFNGYHGNFHGSTSGFNGPNMIFTNGGYFGNRGS